MTPGSTFVVRCPHCSQLGQYDTIASGNTFGARLYSDGVQVAPMLPKVPAIVACTACKNAYWLGQAEVVGDFDKYGVDATKTDPQWAAAGRLKEPDEKVYFACFDTLLLADPDRERDLRLYVWWRGNDPYREGGARSSDAGQPAIVSARDANMRALSALLSNGDDVDSLMRAEVLRELGEFRQALDVLSAPFPQPFGDVVRQLRSWCEANDRQVRELT